MFLIKKPNAATVEQFLVDQSQRAFTYPSVGATRDGGSPAGFVVDRTRIRLGTGESTFTAARRALTLWRHYQFDWIELHRPQGDIAPNQTVGVLARALGLWVLNACRIVYVVTEDQPLRRFAFAYGTLPEHAESGEERFQVEWHRGDDSVWYEILAFSRPHQCLARVGYPYVRRKQKQFAQDSTRAMQTALTARDPD